MADWPTYTDQEHLKTTDTILGRTSGGGGVEMSGDHIFAQRSDGGEYTCVIGGVTRMHIGNDGNVSIGDTTPATRFEIADSVWPRITFLKTGVASWGVGGHEGTNSFRFDYNGSDLVTVLSDGNVGLGTTSPQLKFVVSNGGAAGLEISPNAVAGAPFIQSYNRSGAIYTQLGFDASNYFWNTSGTTRMYLDGSGQLGVGVSPATKFHVKSTGDEVARFEGDTGTNPYISIFNSTGRTAYLYAATAIQLAAEQSKNLEFLTGGAVQATLNTSGFLGVGNAISPSFQLDINANSTDVFRFTSNGASLYGRFRNVGGTAQTWAISSKSASFDIYDETRTATRFVIDSAGDVQPGADDGQKLGVASKRWSEIFCTNATINTSDEREKNWKGSISDEEYKAALQIIKEIGLFRWNEKAAKGRLHFGVRAQRVWAIMAENKLVDPISKDKKPSSKYAFLCYNEWEDNVVDGKKITEAGSRFGIRYEELNLFLMAAQDRRYDEIEERLAKLEA